MPWARASSLDRFLACPAASWLPRFNEGNGRVQRPYLGAGDVEVLHPDFLALRDKTAASRGTKAHELKERGEAYADLYRGGMHEVAVSYCCKTGRVAWLDLETRLRHRDRALDARRKDLWKAMRCEHAVVGTADWVGQAGGALHVDDLKTGWRLPDVLTPQTLFYAMVFSDIARQYTWYGWRPSTPQVAVTITHDPRAQHALGGSAVPPTRYFRWATPAMLEGFRQDLHAAWQMTTLNNRPRPGAHCRYCPSAAWCLEAGG